MGKNSKKDRLINSLQKKIIGKEQKIEKESPLVSAISPTILESFNNKKSLTEKIRLFFLHTLSEFYLPCLIFLLAIFFFSFPWIFNFNRAIPTGSEPATVSFFSLFTFQWTGTSLEQNKSYWDAPYFFPHKRAFAWSEPVPISSFIVWIISKITGYIIAYNLLLLCYMLIAGLAGYALSRLLGLNKHISLIPGLWLACGPFTWQQIGCIPLLSFGVPLFCLFFIFKFMENNNKKYLYLASLCYFLTFGICLQYGVFLTILLPITLIPYYKFFTKEKLQTLFYTKYILTVFVIFLLLSIYLLTQAQYLKEMGFERLSSEVMGILYLENLFTPAKGNWFLKILSLSENPNIYSWNLGITLLLIIFFSLFKSFNYDNSQKRLKTALIFLALFSLLLGFGNSFGFMINKIQYSLYGLFTLIIPGLNGIRSPARFVIFTISVVPILAALFLNKIFRNINNPLMKKLYFILIIIFLALESWSAPITLAYPKEVINSHNKVIDWLKDNKDNKPILELPLSVGDRPEDLQNEVEALLRMIVHRHPIVNGYSSYFPVPFNQLRNALKNGPTELGKRYLETIGVKYILLHKHLSKSPNSDDPSFNSWGTLIYEDKYDVIYSLDNTNFNNDLKYEELFDNLSVKFKNKPVEGEVIGISLKKILEKAILVTPNAERKILFSWQDDNGLPAKKIINLLGSVILDQGQNRFFITLLHFPSGNSSGEARFVSLDGTTAN